MSPDEDNLNTDLSARFEGLSKPEELYKQIVDMSKEQNSQVIFRLQNPDDSQKDYWFNAIALLDQISNPSSSGNIYVKIQDLLQYDKLRVTEVRPFKYDNSSLENDWGNTMDRFKQENGYRDGDFSGLLIRKTIKQ